MNAGGKDVPPIGHLGWIGFTAPLGATLRETLLLNLIPWSHSGLILTGPYDLPAWERAPVSASHEKRPPTGVCDLYTWQGRRIRLFAEQGADGEPAITGVLICAGDALLRGTVQGVEPQTAWRKQTSPNEAVGYSPVSYTHLDVYKRQALPSRLGNPCASLLTPGTAAANSSAIQTAVNTT